jgi:hypothetical protein
MKLSRTKSYSRFLLVVFVVLIAKNIFADGSQKVEANYPLLSRSTKNKTVLKPQDKKKQSKLDVGEQDFRVSAFQVERVNLERIRRQSSFYARQIRRALWIRRSIVAGTGITLGGLIGLLVKSFLKSDYTSQLQIYENDGDGTKTEEQKKEEDRRLKRIEIELIKQTLDLEKKKNSFKNKLKNGFITASLGGASMLISIIIYRSFEPLRRLIWSGLRKIWGRDERYYYVWCRRRVHECISILRHLLDSLNNVGKTKRKKKGIKSDAIITSSVFYSYRAELANAYRMFLFAIERLLGVIAMKSQGMSISDRSRLFKALDHFADELDAELNDQTSEEMAVKPSLIRAFYTVNDILMMIIQSYEARIDE